MLIIGNIVAPIDSKITVPKMNMVTNLSQIDNGYPTLMIGYRELKKSYTLDFLNRKLGDNLFWTFKRDEERTLYNRDLYEFVLHCENYLLSGFVYHPIDPFVITRKRLKKIISATKVEPTILYIDRDSMFLHIKGNTFGFNMAMGEVIGVGREKLINKLNNLPNVTELSEERINQIRLSMGDIEFDTAYFPYLSEKIQD